ncbi:MAG: Cyanophage [Pseudomonadota bacterium]
MARKGLWLVAALVLPVLPAQSAPLAFSVQLSEAVVVDTGGGVPRIALDVGGVTRQADYTGGSGSDTLSFSYAIQAGDFDANGIAALSPIDLNGATISDAAGNAADLGFVPPDMSGVRIQTYTVAWASDPITTANAANAVFTIAKAPIGASFDYSITSSGGGAPVAGSGTISGIAHAVTGVDLSSLPGGTLTLSVTVTTAAGGTGASRTAEVAKTPWTPADLGASLALWLDADDASTITLNGSSVSQWDDKSGNDWHMSQAIATSQPAYITGGLNGRFVIRTDGNDRLGNTTTSLFRNVGVATWVAVGKYPLATGTGNSMLLFCSTGVDALRTRFGLTANPSPGGQFMGVAGRRLGSEGFATAPSSTARIVGSYFIEVGQADYANARANHWTNGIQDLTSASFQTAGNTSDTNPLFVGVFGQSNVLSPTNTEIAEAIAIEGPLPTADRQKLEGYLAHKWGLAADLPAGHPYKAVAP